MTIRKLFPLLFVAVAAAVLMPGKAAAQCWRCDTCHWESDEPNPKSCVGRIQGFPFGFTNCNEPAPCVCWLDPRDFGICAPWEAETAAAETEQLEQTLAAIRAGRSISADGPFVYVRQGADYVVRRRCDAAEMGRVAVADVRPVPVVGAG